jgi:hypothetical protein
MQDDATDTVGSDAASALAGAAPSAVEESAPSVSPLARLYMHMDDLLRDQIAAQLDSASTNDLESVGVIGAALALVVALLILRATDAPDITWWWWYPLPSFAVPTALVAVPLRGSTAKRKFLDGPQVPAILQGFAQQPQTLEAVLERTLRDLQTCWSINDALLAAERKWFNIGILALAIATTISLGLYAWALT